MTKASDNPFPSLLFDESDPPAAPATGYRRLYLNGSNVNVIGSNSTIRPLAWADAVGGSGDVATDAIWDAAGDLAVGTGANTAAKLTKGADGGVLAMGNGAVIWNAGTSFPANKATGDRYFRTDLGLECYWDGTRWVTTAEYSASGALENLSAANSLPALPVPSQFDIYVTRVELVTYVATTNSGSAYWTLTVNKYDTSNAVTSMGSTNTASDSANQRLPHYVSVAAAVGGSATYPGITVTVAKTGSPGNIYYGATIRYRLIVT